MTLQDALWTIGGLVLFGALIYAISATIISDTQYGHYLPYWPGYLLAAIAIATAIIGTIVGIK